MNLTKLKRLTTFLILLTVFISSSFASITKKNEEIIRRVHYSFNGYKRIDVIEEKIEKLNEWREHYEFYEYTCLLKSSDTEPHLISVFIAECLDHHSDTYVLIVCRPRYLNSTTKRHDRFYNIAHKAFMIDKSISKVIDLTNYDGFRSIFEAPMPNGSSKMTNKYQVFEQRDPICYDSIKKDIYKDLWYIQNFVIAFITDDVCFNQSPIFQKILVDRPEYNSIFRDIETKKMYTSINTAYDYVYKKVKSIRDIH